MQWLRVEYRLLRSRAPGTPAQRHRRLFQRPNEWRTANRNLLATYAHTFGNGWGITIVAPVVERNHLHLHNEEDGSQTPERWKFTEFGDMRVLGR